MIIRRMKECGGGGRTQQEQVLNQGVYKYKHQIGEQSQDQVQTINQFEALVFLLFIRSVCIMFASFFIVAVNFKHTHLRCLRNT